jgi:hypothetical protein
MKVKVTEQRVVIPRRLLKGVGEVDPIYKLGSNPVF